MAYAALLLVLAGFSIPCRLSTWHGNAELHTLLETISTVLALLAGAIALKAYYTKKIPATCFSAAASLPPHCSTATTP